jgi:hypothetical protein
VNCYCDFDPPAWMTVRHVKAARRPHSCEECGTPILAGEPYERRTGMWEGMISTFATCPPCRDLRQWAINSFPCYSQCWTVGTVLDDVREWVRETAHHVPGIVMEWGRHAVQVRRRQRAHARNWRASR